MIKPSSIAVTGVVSAARQRFPCPATPSGAALGQSLADALSGAGIAPDGMSAHPGARLPAWRSPAAPGGYAGVLCDLPGMLWALEDIAAALPDVLFVVCYEAPWLALDAVLEQGPDRFLAHPRAALALWCSYYREALRLRTVLGQRMVLVNSGLTGAWDAHLLDYLRDYGVMLERDPDDPDDARGLMAGGGAGARLLDAAAPECWDVYEALEGCALLLGRAPQFRQTLGAPTDADADAVLRRWSAGHGERRARAALAAVEQELDATCAAMAGVQQELDAARATASRRVIELEAELAAERAHILSLRDALLAQSQEAAIQCGDLEHAAAASALAAQQEVDAARAELAGMRKDYLIQGRDFAMQCRAIEHTAAAARDAAAELTVARDELTRVRAALAVQAQECATQRGAMEQHAAAAATARQEIDALRADLDSMLESLHATQETLEQSYAESDALCATATSANALLRQAWLLVAARPRAGGADAMAPSLP